jgi:hypothetical protein
MLTLVIGILMIVAIGALLFWIIEKFVTDAKLAMILRFIVILFCVGAIVQRLSILYVVPV